MYNNNPRDSNPYLQGPIQYRYNPRESTNQIPSNNRGTDISKTSKAKLQDAYKNYQQKFKALGRIRYKNQLAQLQYQQKLTELHTKYSSKTKKSVQNKLRAKNQIAEFIDEQEQQFEQQFEQLMDYKYGASKWKNFHYERESVNKQYVFCSLCDEIHTMSQQNHQKQCKYKELARSPLYYMQSLDRIKNSLSRLTSQEAVELSNLADKIKNSKNVTRELLEIMPLVKNDEVLGKIAAKLKQIIQETY